MKLSNEGLTAIMEALRLGLVEGVDISALLRDLDLVPDDAGRLTPSKPVKDAFTLITKGG